MAEGTLMCSELINSVAEPQEPQRHGWNHQQCYPCWFDTWGLDREPVRYRHGREPEPCCFCGRPTASGILVRVRPGSGEIPCCTDGVIDRSLFWPAQAC